MDEVDRNVPVEGIKVFLKIMTIPTPRVEVKEHKLPQFDLKLHETHAEDFDMHVELSPGCGWERWKVIRSAYMEEKTRVPMLEMDGFIDGSTVKFIGIPVNTFSRMELFVEADNQFGHRREVAKILCTRSIIAHDYLLHTARPHLRYEMIDTLTYTGAVDYWFPGSPFRGQAARLWMPNNFLERAPFLIGVPLCSRRLGECIPFYRFTDILRIFKVMETEEAAAALVSNLRMYDIDTSTVTGSALDRKVELNRDYFRKPTDIIGDVSNLTPLPGDVVWAHPSVIESFLSVLPQIQPLVLEEDIKHIRIPFTYEPINDTHGACSTDAFLRDIAMLKTSTTRRTLHEDVLQFACINHSFDDVKRFLDIEREEYDHLRTSIPSIKNARYSSENARRIIERWRQSQEGSSSNTPSQLEYRTDRQENDEKE